MAESIPSLVPGSQVLRLDDGSVAVRTWHRTFRIRGGAADLTMRILEALDGKARVADVADRLDADRGLVDKALTKLRDAGVVELAAGPSAHWPQRQVLDVASGIEQTNGSPGRGRDGEVLVFGSGRTAELVAGRLRELDEGAVVVIGSLDELAEGGRAAAGMIYAEELMTYRDALAVDSRAAAAGVAWCAGWWEGPRLVVTHELRFGRSACFECLLERQRANYVQPEVDIPLEERLRDGTMTTAGEDDARAVPTLLSSMLADLLVLRARSLLSDGRQAKRTMQMAEFDLTSWELHWSTVLRLPSCARCSPGALRPSRTLA